MTVKYTESGLWIKELSDSFRIGLSVKGQDDVGEVMFVDLPEFGERVTKGDNLLSVEGAKAVTEIVAPFSGSVKNVHTELEEKTELLNSTDDSDNWIIELTNIEDFDSEELSEEPWFGQEPEED